MSSVYDLMTVLYNCSDSLRGFQCVLLIMVIKRVVPSKSVIELSHGVYSLTVLFIVYQSIRLYVAL